MLNIICAGSLVISAAVCQAETAHYLENLVTLPAKGIVNEPLLANGRHHKSDYRIEADRASQGHHRNREHYRYDRYEVEEDRGRIHRDAEQRRREENFESERHIERPRDRRNRPIYYWRK
jgi:hypothetical protein